LVKLNDSGCASGILDFLCTALYDKFELMLEKVQLSFQILGRKPSELEL
jgi:hypothetical protein